MNPVLVRAELLRLFRTEEVFRYALLPALLGVPVLVFAGVFVASLQQSLGTVALPPDLPAPLDLATRLVEQRLDVVERDDPRAAWERGEVDAAVVAWRDAPGIDASTRSRDRARWELDLVADEQEVAGAVRRAAVAGGDAVLADLVALGGGDPDQVIDFVQVVIVDANGDGLDLPFEPRPAAVAYGIFMVGLVGFFFLTLPAVADRREGVTESLRVLPIHPRQVLWARLAALFVVQGLVAVGVVANLALMLGPLLGGHGTQVPGIADIPGTLAGIVLVDALYVAVGVLAPSARTANNASSITMTVQSVLLGLGLFGSPPAWVPMAGLLVAQGFIERALAVGTTVLLAIVVIEVCARLQATRVELVLPKGAE